jgi:hypothetical protein
MSNKIKKLRRRTVAGAIAVGFAGSIFIFPIAPASAFGLGNLGSIISGFIFQQTGVDISPYIQMFQTFQSFLRTKSLSTLAQLGQQIYGQVGGGSNNSNVSTADF